jgi:hypothetical protein
MKYTLPVIAVFTLLTIYGALEMFNTAMQQRAKHHAVMQCMTDTECEATDNMKGSK